MALSPDGDLPSYCGEVVAEVRLATQPVFADTPVVLRLNVNRRLLVAY
jgi:hypothetical protein